MRNKPLEGGSASWAIGDACYNHESLHTPVRKARPKHMTRTRGNWSQCCCGDGSGSAAQENSFLKHETTIWPQSHFWVFIPGKRRLLFIQKPLHECLQQNNSNSFKLETAQVSCRGLSCGVFFSQKNNKGGNKSPGNHPIAKGYTQCDCIFAIFLKELWH